VLLNNDQVPGTPMTAEGPFEDSNCLCAFECRVAADSPLGYVVNVSSARGQDDRCQNKPQHQPSIATLTKHIAICTSSPCLQSREIYLSIKFYLYVPPLATAHTPFVVSHLHPVGLTTTIAICPISSYTPLYISLPRPRMDQTPSIARDSGFLEL
jgi:hypothetical protein